MIQDVFFGPSRLANYSQPKLLFQGFLKYRARRAERSLLIRRRGVICLRRPLQDEIVVSLKTGAVDRRAREVFHIRQGVD